MKGAPQYLADERANDIDMLVIRENSEGEYVNQGGRLAVGTENEIATQVALFTHRATDRIIRHAFEQARVRAAERAAEGRDRTFGRDAKASQVCVVTKRNAQRFWGDMWTDMFAEIAKEYPDEYWVERAHTYKLADDDGNVVGFAVSYSLAYGNGDGGVTFYFDAEGNFVEERRYYA